MADEAAERVALGLLRAADALDRCAAGFADFPDASSSNQFAQKAESYHNAARKYRRLAAEYRANGIRPDHG
jgi:hypothetical protein